METALSDKRQAGINTKERTMAEIDVPERKATRTAINNVDDFIANAKRWREELNKLRAILLDSELTEEFKWYQPCYTFHGRDAGSSLPLCEKLRR